MVIKKIYKKKLKGIKMEKKAELAEIIKLHRSVEVDKKGLKTISSSSEENDMNNAAKNQLEIVTILEKHKRKIDRLEEAMAELQDIIDDIMGRLDDIESRPEIVYPNIGKYR